MEGAVEEAEVAAAPLAKCSTWSAHPAAATPRFPSPHAEIAPSTAATASSPSPAVAVAVGAAMVEEAAVAAAAAVVMAAEAVVAEAAAGVAGNPRSSVG